MLVLMLMMWMLIMVVMVVVMVVMVVVMCNGAYFIYKIFQPADPPAVNWKAAFLRILLSRCFSILGLGLCWANSQY